MKQPTQGEVRDLIKNGQHAGAAFIVAYNKSGKSEVSRLMGISQAEADSLLRNWLLPRHARRAASLPAAGGAE